MYMLIYGYFIALILAPKGSMAYIHPLGPSKRDEHIGWEINVICNAVWAEPSVLLMWTKLRYDNTVRCR